MRMGVDVFRDAGETKPRAGRAVVMTSAADTAINLRMAIELAAIWEDEGASVATKEFPLELGVPHDSIDPAQPGARTDVVYPELLERIAP